MAIIYMLKQNKKQADINIAQIYRPRCKNIYTRIGCRGWRCTSERRNHTYALIHCIHQIYRLISTQPIYIYMDRYIVR
jgi:hypothetical protein